MILGPDYVYQCPNCGEKVLQMGVKSANTLGCTFYSDQRIEGPMFYSSEIICRCPYCNHIYWLDHRNNTGHYPLLSEDPEIEAIPRAESPTLKDYFDAIDQKVYCNGKELIYLRKKIWQTGNQLLSLNESLPSGYSMEDLLQNMQELYLLIPDVEESHKIVKAELTRNMGDFETCREILSLITDTKYEEAKSRLQDECLRENTKTVILWKDKLPW